MFLGLVHLHPKTDKWDYLQSPNIIFFFLFWHRGNSWKAWEVELELYLFVCLSFSLSNNVISTWLAISRLGWSQLHAHLVECPKNLKMFKLDLTWSSRSGWTWTWPDLNLLKQNLTWLELEVSNQFFFK